MTFLKPAVHELQANTGQTDRQAATLMPLSRVEAGSGALFFFATC